MDKGFYIYCITMSLQLSGAIILIYEWFRKAKELVISEYYNAGGMAISNGKAYIVKNRIISSLYRIYINRMAFLYIACGYAFNLLGEMVTLKKNYAFAIVVSLSAVIIVITIFFIKFIVIRITFKKYEKAVYNADLPDGAIVFEYESEKDEYNTLNKISEVAEFSANNENKRNKISYYRKSLIEEIHGERDEFLRLKMECYQKADDSIFNTVISTVSLIMAIIAIISSFSNNSIQNNKIEYDMVFLVISLVIYTIIITAYAVNHLKTKKKYKYMTILIDDIEKNWDIYFPKITLQE